MIERIPVGGYRGRGLHGEVAERLGQRILSGELVEGGTLALTQLQSESDVSRSVIPHNELLARTEAVLGAGLAVRDRLVHEAHHADPTAEHAAVLAAIRDANPAAAVEAATALLVRSLRDLDRLHDDTHPPKPRHE